MIVFAPFPLLQW